MKRSRPQSKVRRSRGWSLFLTTAALVGIGFGAWRILAEAQASRDLFEGRAALDRGEFASARERLANCLKTWPDSAEAHFLSARAARRAGDLAAAARSLNTAKKSEWVAEAIDLERALIAAQAGSLANVENYLVTCVEKDHPDTVLILEVLVPLYVQNYRLMEALAYLQMWVKRQPDAVRAWLLLGDVDERLQLAKDAADAYAEAVNRAPDQHDARLRLAKVLVELRRAVEAQPYFEELLRQTPQDAEVRLGLARCHIDLGHRDQARALLDELLKKPPKADVVRQQPGREEVLAERGRLELECGHAAEAELWLRQAVEGRPYEVPFLYLLLRCLRQSGKEAEVAALQVKLQESEESLNRLRALTKAIARSPRDAGLRYEAGVIFLDSGQEREGLRWLESALREDPLHSATHEKLAQYYERSGQEKQADQHRALAKKSPSRR
jgi:tetratricopeptide (TPR) repeat protein